MSPDDVKLRHLIQICDLFQSAAGPTIPLAMVEAFLLVALYEGASLKDLCRLSGQAQSTLSRHLLDLADRNRKGGPGLKLVAWRRAPEEERRKEYYLTAKGRALRDRILQAPGREELPEVQFSLASVGTVPGYRSTEGPRTRRTRVKGPALDNG
jgi:DNA-binding MarR family transcriptional regulator